MGSGPGPAGAAGAATTKARTTGTPSPSGGAIPAAYRALVAAGCDVDRAGIATPIDARVLRNTPFALAGRDFTAAELRQLYASDGNWYRPVANKSVTLAKPDRACVARLQQHERTLRQRVVIKPRVEARLTSAPHIFLGLRGLARPGLRLGTGEQGSNDDGVYWIAPCNRGCQQVAMTCDVDGADGALVCQVDQR